MFFHGSMVNLLGTTPLEKIFAFPSSYQLPIAPYVGLRFYDHPPSSCLDFVWLELVQVLGMLLQPSWIHMCIYPDVSGKHFMVIYHFWLLHSLHPIFFHPWASEGGCDEDVLFRTYHFLLCYFLSLDHLLVFELIAIYCKKNLPWWDLRNTPIYWCSNKSLGVSLILCPFSRVTVGYLLIPMTYLITGCWHW